MDVKLSNSKVQMLNDEEMQTTNGGWLIQTLLTLLVCEVIDGTFIDDVKRGYHETSGR